MDSPYRTLCNFLLSRSILDGHHEKNTIINRVAATGVSPTRAYFDINDCVRKMKSSIKTYESDGVVDSLRFLLHDENFVKPWSSQHLLASLLVRAF